MSDKLIRIENIEKSILFIRGRKVMLDTDLAELYGVTTKALNQAVKRNRPRFPEDFIFQLTQTEKDELVTICDHLRKVKYSRHLPYAFTEHGAVMVANLLNSPRAAEISVHVVRAFVRMREIITSHNLLVQKIADLEKHYDHKFKVVFDAIYELMNPPKRETKKIGF